MQTTLAILLALAAGAAYAQTVPAANLPADSTASLVGTWQLVRYEDYADDGTPEYPYGTTPVGLLVYDTTGHMTVQIMEAPVDTTADDDGSPAYTAYFGTFMADWARHVMTHHVEANLYRAFVGTSNERTFTLVGDRLTLTPVQEPGRPVLRGVRVFERVQ